MSTDAAAALMPFKNKANLDLGGIRFELRDTHDYKLSDANDKISNEPPTSIIYLKVSFPH